MNIAGWAYQFIRYALLGAVMLQTKKERGREKWYTILTK